MKRKKKENYNKDHIRLTYGLFRTVVYYKELE